MCHNHLEIAVDTQTTTAGAATAVGSGSTRYTDCRLVTEAAYCFAIHEDR